MKSNRIGVLILYKLLPKISKFLARQIKEASCDISTPYLFMLSGNTAKSSPVKQPTSKTVLFFLKELSILTRHVYSLIISYLYNDYIVP
jgi:hypothetical protein